MTDANFCDQCGVSLVPLPGVHVSRPCRDCGKETFLAEPGEGGRGVKVEKGDRFHIPAGAIQMSLDPTKSTGRFTRAGTISFVTGHLLTANLPKDGTELRGYLDVLDQEVEDVLHQSEKTSEFDLNDDDDTAKLVELVRGDQLGPEWTAVLIEVFRNQVVEALDGGVDPDAIARALQLQAQVTVLVYKLHLANYVWTGYEQVRAVYDIAAAAARTPEEEVKIRALHQAFQRLDEATLFAWVDAQAPMGEKLGVTGVDEATLLGLARYELSLRERQRQDEERAKDRRIEVGRFRLERWKAAAALVVPATVMGGLVGQVVDML